MPWRRSLGRRSGNVSSVALSELRWHPEAIRDAESARNWYAERSPFAARGFLLALEDAVRAVLDAPERWPLRTHGCRHYSFPVSISLYPHLPSGAEC